MDRRCPSRTAYFSLSSKLYRQDKLSSAWRSAKFESSPKTENSYVQYKGSLGSLIYLIDFGIEVVDSLLNFVELQSHSRVSAFWFLHRADMISMSDQMKWNIKKYQRATALAFAGLIQMSIPTLVFGHSSLSAMPSRFEKCLMMLSRRR